jgi:hypothetical protein
MRNMTMTKIPRNPNNSSNSSMHIGYLPQFNTIQELKRLIWKTTMDLNEGGSNAYVALVVSLLENHGPSSLGCRTNLRASKVDFNALLFLQTTKDYIKGESIPVSHLLVTKPQDT